MGTKSVHHNAFTELRSLIPLNKALIMDTLSAECAHVAAAGSLPADI